MAMAFTDLIVENSGNKQTMTTSEGIPSPIDIEFLELNVNPYRNDRWLAHNTANHLLYIRCNLFELSCYVVGLMLTGLIDEKIHQFGIDVE